MSSSSHLYTAKQINAYGLPNILGHAAVYSDKLNSVIIFSGTTAVFSLTKDYVPYSWTYNVVTEYWSRDSMMMPPRAFHSAVMHEATQTAYIYGGTGLTIDTYNITGVIPASEKLNELWSYTVTTDTWVYLGNTGALGGRSGHCACIDNKNSDMYIFGGLTTGILGYGSDLWKYNINTKIWTSLGVSSMSGRIYSTLVYDPLQQLLYMYGGSTGFSNYNELWRYNLTSNGWNKVDMAPLTSVSNEYMARSSHTSFYDPLLGYLYSIGGTGALYTDNNILIMDVRRGNASLIQSSSITFTHQRSHAGAYNRKNGTIYTFGGQGNNFQATNFSWLIQVAPEITRVATVVASLSSSSQPHPSINYTIYIIIGVLVFSILVALFLLLYYYKRRNKGDDDYKYEFSMKSTRNLLTPRDGWMSFRSLDMSSLDTSRERSYSRNFLQFFSSNTHATFTISDDDGKNKQICIPSINWKNIQVCESDKILGTGSFGVVLGAKMRTSDRKFIDVAIKILNEPTRSPNRVSPTNTTTTTAAAAVVAAQNDKQQNIYMNKVLKEVDIVMTARKQMIHPDHVIEIYGIVQGHIPADVCKILSKYPGSSALGIVMRYEGGGSLGSKMYTNEDDDGKKVGWTIDEKLSILKSIAYGLAEIHSVGVIHGDIKPDNILLSADSPPQIRLADFGLSNLKNDTHFDDTTMHSTIHARGSPIYSAPEMLVNPYLGEINNYKVALPSRRTDMYAFAILAWELLVGTKPYSEYKFNEVTLSMAVHQGVRPSLEKLPSDCPREVIDMISLCWQSERLKRLTALSCYRILNNVEIARTEAYSDVFISCHPDDMTYIEPLYSLLDSYGAKVTCNSTRDIHTSMTGDITPLSTVTPLSAEWKAKNISTTTINRIKSKAILACISPKYQADESCIAHLLQAKSCRPAVPIIPLFLETTYEDWISPEIRYYCQLRSSSTRHFVYDTRTIYPAASSSTTSDKHLMRNVQEKNGESHHTIQIQTEEDDEYLNEDDDWNKTAQTPTSKSMEVQICPPVIEDSTYNIHTISEELRVLASSIYQEISLSISQSIANTPRDHT